MPAQTLTEPMLILKGHTQRINILQFHPTAKNVLASTCYDFVLKLWNIENIENSAKCVLSIQHPDLITSMHFNAYGDKLVTMCKDNKLR